MKASELRTKSSQELQALIAEKRTELVEKQRSLKAGELANPRSITKIRREIAVVMTIAAEQTAAKEEK